MTAEDPFAGNEDLKRIVTSLFETPERAEWIPKTNVIALADFREWISSEDMEILGFAYSMSANRRFRIEPPFPLEDYLRFMKHYIERCFRESPDGEWSDSRWTAGWDLVNIFARLWRDPETPRSVLRDLKEWLAGLYKGFDEDIRRCIVQATLEHLFEQKPIRQFFSDWKNDAILRAAYEDACLWPDGGGRTPLGKAGGKS